MSKQLVEILACPECKHELTQHQSLYSCIQCGKEYGVRNNKPFFLKQRIEGFHNSEKIRTPNRNAVDYLKEITRDFLFGDLRQTKKNTLKLIELISNKKEKDGPIKVLFVGVGNGGFGFADLLKNELNINVIGLDISDGYKVDVLGDAHKLPFKDKVFDLIIAQAVFEHLSEPKLASEEIFRTLKSDGLIYAETPFLQPVHEGIYDYQRYTLTGHRLLFKQFKLIDSGIIGNSFLSLSWIFKSIIQKSILSFLGILIWLPLALFLKFLEIATNFFFTSNSSDAYNGVYFIGKKEEGFLFDEPNESKKVFLQRNFYKKI